MKRWKQMTQQKLARKAKRKRKKINPKTDLKLTKSNLKVRRKLMIKKIKRTDSQVVIITDYLTRNLQFKINWLKVARKINLKVNLNTKIRKRKIKSKVGKVVMKKFWNNQKVINTNEDKAAVVAYKKSTKIDLKSMKATAKERKKVARVIQTGH